MKKLNLVKFGMVVLVLVALSQWAAPVMAQGPGMGGPRGHHMMGGGLGIMPPFVFKKLSLTDTQQAQIQGIMADYRTTVQPLFQQLKTIHEGMADKFYAPGNLTRDDFTSQTQQVSQLEEQIKLAGIDAALKARSVLSPTQLAQAAQIKTQMQTLHAEMESLVEGQ
ncbi:MAG TPA: periplasmic heavy metal sensor [Candidatus Binatia bacterium]|nr:periplasmic heavy metal sensor [Candidatus Binatia bacterium]